MGSRGRRWLQRLVVGAFCSMMHMPGAEASMYADDARFMPVEQVQTGMRGIAKTVARGDAMTTFDVEILGIMKQRGPSGDLILASFSGPLIEETGGIAHGMSGSPVYIDGRLVGAVAYGWGFTRSHIGMITPIHQMLDIWDQPQRDDLPKPWKVDGRLIPLGTPLMASGMEPQALEFLQKTMSDYRIQAYDTASTPADDTPHPLYEGSSLAATLIDGDLRLGAIGTVTYVDGDRIVAFGHPYLKEGASGYFLHNSSILSIVNSVESSFKLGTIGAPIGAITEDRGAGIAGRVGATPPFIPVAIHTLDLDRGTMRDAHVRVVEDASLTPSLVATSVYNFLTKTMDRRGGGTAQIQYRFHPVDTSLPTYERSDMFYVSNGIALESIDEFYSILKKLMQNPFRPYDIRAIDVDVAVTRAQQTAQIMDATASPAVVRPGDVVEVEVELLPFRGKREQRRLSFTIPEDQKTGNLVLEVRGGGVTPLPYLIERQKWNLTDEVSRRLRTYKDFDAYMKRLLNIGRNNQIVVEILNEEESHIDTESTEGVPRVKLTSLGNRPDSARPGMTPEEYDPLLDGFDEDTPRSLLNTDYVIEGDGQLSLTVVEPKDYDKAVASFRLQRKKEQEAQAKKKKGENKPGITLLRKTPYPAN